MGVTAHRHCSQTHRSAADVVTGAIDGARHRDTLRGMTNIAPPKLLTHLWKSTLVSGVLAVVLGVLVLMWPGISIVAASVIFGVYLLVSGVAQVLFACSLHVGTGARILLFLSGAASLILAVLAFRHLGQGYAILLLAIWIAVGFIFRGVATTGRPSVHLAFPDGIGRSSLGSSASSPVSSCSRGRSIRSSYWLSSPGFGWSLSASSKSCRPSGSVRWARPSATPATPCPLSMPPSQRTRVVR